MHDFSISLALARRYRRVLQSFWRRDDGNVMVVTGLSMVLVLGSLDLGAEGGYWFYRHRQLQTAADVAAYAGAVELRNGLTAGAAESTAAAETTVYNVTGSVDTNAPPASGNYTNDRSMEVLITETE